MMTLREHAEKNRSESAARAETALDYYLNDWKGSNIEALGCLIINLRHWAATQDEPGLFDEALAHSKSEFEDESAALTEAER